MKNAPRDYKLLITNDRPVIFFAAARHTLLDIIQLSDRAPLQAKGYATRSFPTLLAYLKAGIAGYVDALPRKLRENFFESVNPAAALSSFHQLVHRGQKANLDHVTFARLGISAICVLVIKELHERAHEIEDMHLEALAQRDVLKDEQKLRQPENEAEDDEDESVDHYGLPESSNQVYFDEVIGLVAERLPLVEGLLQQASRRVLAENGCSAEQMTIEVISHDLTAPVIVACPDPRPDLIAADRLAAQIPHSEISFAYDNLERIADQAVEELLDEEAYDALAEAGSAPE